MAYYKKSHLHSCKVKITKTKIRINFLLYQYMSLKLVIFSNFIKLMAISYKTKKNTFYFFFLSYLIHEATDVLKKICFILGMKQLNQFS